MEIGEVERLIRAGIADAEILVEGEGCNFSVIVVSESFRGCSLVKKQQRVLATVTEPLATGALHALSVKAFTPEEWREHRAKESGLVQIG